MKSTLILSVAVASAVCPAFAAPTPLSPQTNWKRGELSADVNAIVKAAVQDGLVPANVGAALAQLVNDTAPGLAVLFGDLLSDSNTNSTKPSKRGLSSIGDLAKLTAQQIEALIRNNKLTPQQVEALRKGSNNNGRSLAAEFDRVGTMARRDDDAIPDHEDPKDVLEMPSDDEPLDKRYTSWRPSSHSHSHNHSSSAHTPSPSHTPAHHKLPHPSHTPSKSHGHHVPSSSASAGPRSGHHSVRDLLAQLKVRDMELD